MTTEEEDTGTAGMYEASMDAKNVPPATIDPDEDLVAMLAEGAAAWKDMLVTLVPPKDVKVPDVTGFVHELRCWVPATIQTDLSRKLDALLDAPNLGGSFQEVMLAPSNGDRLLAIMKALTGIAKDETVLQLMSDSFALAHPRAAKQAALNVAKDEWMSEFIPEGEKVEPKHAFERIQLVAALFPFVLKEVADGKNIMMKLTSQPQ